MRWQKITEVHAFFYQEEAQIIILKSKRLKKVEIWIHLLKVTKYMLWNVVKVSPRRTFLTSVNRKGRVRRICCWEMPQKDTASNPEHSSKLRKWENPGRGMQGHCRYEKLTRPCSHSSLQLCLFPSYKRKSRAESSTDMCVKMWQVKRCQENKVQIPQNCAWVKYTSLWHESIFLLAQRHWWETTCHLPAW